MDTYIPFALTGVLVTWVAVLLAIRRWGPGVLRRSLHCPEKKALARVTFERQEGSFGSLKVVDVKQCSLFPDGAIACEKHCMG